MMRDDIRAFLKSGRPLLLSNDVDLDTVEDLEGRAEQELLDASTQTYIRVQSVYARRKP